MSVKLLDLNIEGHKHLDRWLPFAQAGSFEVITLQEVFEQDLPTIAAALGMEYSFCPIMNIAKENRYKIPPLGLWGVAIFTNLKHAPAEFVYYAGSADLHIFEKPGDASRALLSCEVEKEGKTYRCATTHFTWTPDGQSTPQQERDLASLKRALTKYPDWILAGDFNAPRGGEIFTQLAAILKDNVPTSATTTIDASLHYSGALQLVVDSIFTSSEYETEQVEVVTGLSDHCGITALIKRI